MAPIPITSGVTGDGDGDGADNSDFWELTPLVLTGVQALLYLYMLYEYQDKLRDLASDLSSWANQDENIYRSFRDMDGKFYDYYKDLPEYEVCESAVNRNKGYAFYAYGSSMRGSLRTTRGYTPLKNVHINHMIADRQHVTSIPAMARANTLIAERRRRDVHMLERWSAIVSAPIAQDGYNASAVGSIIRESFSAISSMGQGFNSAGAAFGSQLYKVLS